ncbi:unnamed protein product, partial [Mesorhabditis spiculigera]
MESYSKHPTMKKLARRFSKRAWIIRVENGVGHTVAGRKCVQLCDQRPNRFYQLDPTYMPCFEAFPRIKRCFHEEIKMKAIKKYVVGALHNQLKSGMDDGETKKGRGFLNSGDNQSEKPRNFF